MARVTIDDEILTGIADAIRDKTETEDGISPLNFAQMIESISGGEDNGLFFQEYSSANDVQLNNYTHYIDIDVDDVEWLIFFPLQSNLGGQYACNGGVYIPNVLGRMERTSYGVSTSALLGCGSGEEMRVVDGQLLLRRSNNTYIISNVRYGIVGKAKK